MYTALRVTLESDRLKKVAYCCYGMYHLGNLHAETNYTLSGKYITTMNLPRERVDMLFSLCPSNELRISTAECNDSLSLLKPRITHDLFYFLTSDP